MKYGSTRHVFIYMLKLLLFSYDLKAEPSCSPKSYEDLVRCAILQAAEIKIADQQLLAANHLMEIARQWSNPELEAERVQKNSSLSETTVSLLFNVPLGGKRGAAVREAKGAHQKAVAQRDLDSAKAKLQIILTLYRLNHLSHEIKIEEESVATFSKIISQFKRRAVLSPEQEVSLSIFRMANSDHDLNLVHLRNEMKALLSEFTASTNIAKELVLPNLPTHKTNWPDVGNETSIDKSPQSRMAIGELKMTEGQNAMARAQAWPDLKIGPTVKFLNETSGTDTFYGLSLSMPLPVFSQNGASRAFNSQKLIEAEMTYSLTNKKLLHFRQQLAEKYQTTVQTLKTSVTDKSAEDKHERIEQHFFRGLVSGSLVIEAHRQLIELEQTRNQSELEAIEALGSIMIIDNQFAKAVL